MNDTHATPVPREGMYPVRVAENEARSRRPAGSLDVEISARAGKLVGGVAGRINEPAAGVSDVARTDPRRIPFVEDQG